MVAIRTITVVVNSLRPSVRALAARFVKAFPCSEHLMLYRLPRVPLRASFCGFASSDLPVQCLALEPHLRSKPLSALLDRQLVRGHPGAGLHGVRHRFPMAFASEVRANPAMTVSFVYAAVRRHVDDFGAQARRIGIERLAVYQALEDRSGRRR